MLPRPFGFPAMLSHSCYKLQDEVPTPYTLQQPQPSFRLNQ